MSEDNTPQKCGEPQTCVSIRLIFSYYNWVRHRKETNQSCRLQELYNLYNIGSGESLIANIRGSMHTCFSSNAASPLSKPMSFTKGSKFFSILMIVPRGKLLRTFSNHSCSHKKNKNTLHSSTSSSQTWSITLSGTKRSFLPMSERDDFIRFDKYSAFLSS